MILVAPLAVLALAASVSDQPPPSCCTPSGRGAMLVAVSAPSAAPATNSTTGPVASPAADGSNTPNAVSLGMVWIPGGEFQMGSTDPLARPDEAPVEQIPCAIRVEGYELGAPTEIDVPLPLVHAGVCGVGCNRIPSVGVGIRVHLTCGRGDWLE